MLFAYGVEDIRIDGWFAAHEYEVALPLKVTAELLCRFFGDCAVSVRYIWLDMGK